VVLNSNPKEAEYIEVFREQAKTIQEEFLNEKVIESLQIDVSESK